MDWSNVFIHAHSKCNRPIESKAYECHFMGFFRLLLGLGLRPTILAPSGEFSFSWVIIFLNIQNGKFLIHHRIQVDTYRLLSVTHYLPLTRGSHGHSLEVTLIVLLCSWVLSSDVQKVAGTVLSTFAAK
jgi:hypothetical protein